VQLMTTHSAKGLEFDAVFVTGLEEGLFPHENALTQSARFGEAASAGGAGRGQATPVEQGLEEERRLMYVAITRARQRLYLSFSQTRMLHGQTRYSLKSRFIDELPDAALKWLTPRVQSRGAGSREGWGGVSWESLDRGHGRAPVGGYGTAGERRATHDSGRLGAHDKRAAQHFDRGIAYRVGQSVAHARFGEGVIVNVEGNGDDARVQVNFGREGMKWLALSVAKLQAVAS
jgi:DNA helicase II / ATP-dependent DNA helicase PcrA